ncbi:MAG: hypothetical protein ABI340_02380 [Nitrososphaera sp.]|jgi:hypothetical protein
MKKKRKGKARIVHPINVNYTFINDGTISIQSEEKNDKSTSTRKNLRDTKKSLKDPKATKMKYRSNRSPKSQQGHSPVYE